MFAQTRLWKNAFEFDYRIYSNKRRSLGSMCEEKQNQDNIWLISTHKMNIALKKDTYLTHEMAIMYYQTRAREMMASRGSKIDSYYFFLSSMLLLLKLQIKFHLTSIT